jgi:two-component system chemotaxis sensor kinase CheA
VLLFRGLDGSRRALRLAVVDRIEEVAVEAVTRAAGQLRVQLGDRILPLAGVQEDQLRDGRVRLFRLNDGSQELAYAFKEVVDFATIEGDIIHSESPGEVSGVSLIRGEPAEIVDPHWLFARHVSEVVKTSDPLVCRIPGDDPWMQNMLRPIIEAAGYRVVGDDDTSEVDLVIASQGEQIPAEGASHTIWLRPEPESAGKKDDSIYRYDRAGLLMALKSAGRGK